ncbi:hypothetical protein MW887_000218 [Aspergillus wentii]|nr:hypothetical protein MW887_000218 [Aspergillus wentii]
MAGPPFLSLFRQPLRKTARIDETEHQHEGLTWIESPVDEKDGDPPHLYCHADATPIELFFDLFFVADLSTFTATHEINNVEALWAYVGFLGVIWFTWLQVTLFDIRFARDSVFERICKALQLGVMVGIASAGTRFTTRVRDENIWAFKSLSLLLGGSRFLLAVQYAVTVLFLHKKMRPSIKGISFAFQEQNILRSHLWAVWFVLFGVEMWTVMGVSYFTPDIGFQNTHLNVRMGLLTLIIIGEGVISVTRIVNKTVRPGGWTKWSFVHILGVTTNVYLLWQAYYDLSPRRAFGRLSQQVWAQLHFPFHVVLILLLEGSQILALALDITLKLTYLRETFQYACEEPRPTVEKAIKLLRTTISNMEINYNLGAVREQAAILDILGDLPNKPLCPGNGIDHSLTDETINDLVGNVTAALFSSMGITPSEKLDIIQMTSDQLLAMYMDLLGFVYVYFFVAATLAMALFAAFVPLARRHNRKLYTYIGLGARIVLVILMSGLILFSAHLPLEHSFMKSPTILYAVTFTLLSALLVDRLLDHLGQRREARVRQTQGSDNRVQAMTAESPIPTNDTLHYQSSITSGYDRTTWG